MSAGLRRPIRVVLFSGAYLDGPALSFAAALEAHPSVELLEVLCQAPAAGWQYRFRELWKRRGILTATVVFRDSLGAALRFLRDPRGALARRRVARQIARKVLTVPDLHAPEIILRVRDWKPDLGAVYGAPILRQGLFGIPALGTFGIHHGRVPNYRGRKTTFWEIYNGEKVAGVTIQRIDAGIDTGEVIKAGEVLIGKKGYGRVERETQVLGQRLFVEAILDARAGVTTGVPQPAVKGRHYGQPNAAHFLRLWLRVLGRQLGTRSV